MTDLLEQFAKRHSVYDINNKISLSLAEIRDILYKILSLYPSSYNSQDVRLILLSGERHLQFWELTEKVLLQSAPADKADNIRKRIKTFSQGFGTILYFTDTDIVSRMETEMPLYAENFKYWSYQNNGILQFMVWNILAEKNIGASLQHYNPLIDDAVQQTFQTPKNWKLMAQMPFGGINTAPKPHKTQDIEEKLVILDK